MFRRAIITCALLACGCHESLGLTGDARMDPSIEWPIDAVEDVDAHEIPADILPDGTETCVPPGDVFMHWTVDGEEWEGSRHFEIPCTVVAAAEEDVDHTIVELECGYEGAFERHFVEVLSIPHPWLEYLTGESVILYYFSQSWEWQERWFTLRDSRGEILIAGLVASELCPAFFNVDEWYNPLSVRLATGLCPRAEGPCGSYERAALDIGYMDDRKLVFDDTSTIIGDRAAMHVTVDVVQQWDPVTCWDHPASRIGALFVLIPEG